MKIKVCGMKEKDNVREIVQTDPDILGFIFYPLSARYVGTSPDREIFKLIPESVKKAAVFVNENTSNILSTARRFDFDYIQLHGSENPVVCNEIRSKGYKIIKAFGIDQSFNFTQLEPFIDCCDYFLFDTKSAKHGGSGIKFDWSCIELYNYATPFFLSGGIGPNDLQTIMNLKHPLLYAVDINSRFENEPGIKNVQLVKDFISTLKLKEK